MNMKGKWAGGLWLVGMIGLKREFGVGFSVGGELSIVLIPAGTFRVRDAYYLLGCGCLSVWLFSDDEF